MKSSPTRTWRIHSVIAGLMFAIVVSGQASAEQGARREKPKPDTRRVEALGERTYARLEKARNAMAEERYNDAHQILGELSTAKLNDHERAIVEQTFGFLEASRDRYSTAAKHFERCLAIGTLPDAAMLSTRFNLAQMYLVMDRMSDAIREFELWFAQAENPDADAHYMLGSAYAHSGIFSKAHPHAVQAVSKSKAAHEQRMQLLVAVSFELQKYADAARVLRRLAARFPKKEYWMQLSGAYIELGDTRRALAAQEAAYEQGLLTEDQELLTLAQLLLQAEIPYEAAAVIRQGLDNGVLKPNAETWEMLAISYLQSRETEHAIEPLEKMAELTGDGNHYVQIGQIHVDNGRWGAARQALQRAVAKGGLKDPARAELLLGIANVREGDYSGARQAFSRATKDPKTSKAASAWLRRIDDEIALVEAEQHVLPAK